MKHTLETMIQLIADKNYDTDI